MIEQVSEAVSKFFGRSVSSVAENTLFITGSNRESARQTKERMNGGWLVTLGAHPETRQRLEDWTCEAFDRAFSLVSVDKKDSEAWYSVAAVLKHILEITEQVSAARADKTTETANAIAQ